MSLGQNCLSVESNKNNYWNTENGYLRILDQIFVEFQTCMVVFKSIQLQHRPKVDKKNYSPTSIKQPPLGL